jgi:aminoglycoside phosphotransferase (APT) family kinase protein
VQERLLAYVAPRLRNGAVAITGVQELRAGWETEIWFFTAVYGDGRSEDLVLRIYPGAGGAKLAANEGRVYTALRAEGYPVPELLLSELDPAPFGGPYLVIERLPGPVMGQGTPVEDLPEFMRLFVQLHRVNWRKYVTEPDEIELVAAEERAAYRVAGYQRWFARLGKEALAAPWLAWMEQRARSVASPEIVLTHSDYHPYNVLHRADGSLAVIDWGGARLDDYRYDLAWTWLLTRAYAGPEAAGMILQGYEVLAGAPVVDFDFFVAFSLGRRLFGLVISMQDGAGAVGMRPGMEEQFRREIGHCHLVCELLHEWTGLRLPEVEAFLAAQ